MSSGKEAGKKKGGGFLSRQARDRTKGKPITEDELSTQENIAPDDVLRLTCVTNSEFVSFPYQKNC